MLNKQASHKRIKLKLNNTQIADIFKSQGMISIEFKVAVARGGGGGGQDSHVIREGHFAGFLTLY